MGPTSWTGVGRYRLSKNLSPERCLYFGPDGLAVVEFKPLELYIFTDVFASN